MALFWSSVVIGNKSLLRTDKHSQSSCGLEYWTPLVCRTISREGPITAAVRGARARERGGNRAYIVTQMRKVNRASGYSNENYDPSGSKVVFWMSMRLKPVPNCFLSGISLSCLLPFNSIGRREWPQVCVTRVGGQRKSEERDFRRFARA